MAATSFLYVIDLGLRASLFSKFGDIQELPSVNKGVVFHPDEMAFREFSEKTGADAGTEFISLWRTRTGGFDWSRQRSTLGLRGITMQYVDESTKERVTNVKAVPVSLEYTITFWSKSPETINLLIERYLFWQLSNPNLNLLYDETFPAELDLHTGEVVDVTNYNQYDNGIQYKWQAVITVDGWVFTSVEIPTFDTIILTFYDWDDVDDYTEIIVEDSNQNTELEATLKLFERRITST